MSKQKVVNTQEVFECLEKGMNVNEISKKLKISRPTIYIKRKKWMELHSKKQVCQVLEADLPEVATESPARIVDTDDLITLTKEFRAKIESVREEYKKAVSDILAKI